MYTCYDTRVIGDVLRRSERWMHRKRDFNGGHRRPRRKIMTGRAPSRRRKVRFGQILTLERKYLIRNDFGRSNRWICSK